MRAIARLLPDSEAGRRAGLDALHKMLGTSGALPEEGARRLARVEAMFSIDAQPLKVAHA